MTSPSHDPVWWVFTDGKRQVKVLAQTWYQARSEAQRLLGTEAVVIVDKSVTS